MFVILLALVSPFVRGTAAAGGRGSLTHLLSNRRPKTIHYFEAVDYCGSA
jgi:hypothetical protein